MEKSIQNLVEKHVNFKSPPSNSWRKCYCEVCGDGSRTKGPRGGWLFKDNAAFYNCFNCGINGSFDPSREIPLSKNMKQIFDAFGISYKDYVLFTKTTTKTQIKHKKVSEAKEIKIPSFFADLKTRNTEIANHAKKFLLEEKNISPDEYQFYIVDEIPKNLTPEEKALAKFSFARIIIPAYKNGKMIYYQSRDIGLREQTTKYLSPKGISKSNIFYFYDRLYEQSERPLYVCEGFFDAFHVKGIATMENDLSKDQIELLKRSNRRLVLIPDNNGDSNTLLEIFLNNNWGVSFVDQSVKDVTESIKKFGKLKTCYDIAKNTKTGIQAKAYAKMFVKNLKINI
jgi:hypothetical protein